MARRRMIDPNIWGSEDMSKLTIRQRLLVIGLFSNADDYGKGKAKATYIRSIVFPYDDIPIPDIIDDLEAIRATITIHFYEVEGNSYYKFINWEKWQTVQKPQPSIIPEPVENDSLLSPEPFSPKRKEEKRKEEGKEEKGIAYTPESHSHFNDPVKDRLYKFAEECKIKGLNIVSMERDIFFFLDKMDFEVIEEALKKSFEKHLGWALKILHDWLGEGKTKKEQVSHKYQKVHHLNRGQPQKPKPTVYEAPKTELTQEEKNELNRIVEYLESPKRQRAVGEDETF